VVDDVADSADMMTLLIRLWGYDVEACYGGVAALNVARSYRPQVVLLDIGMAGMDGFQVALGLREMSALAGTVVIGISGHAGEACRARALAAGFDHYLVKPEDPVHLRELLTLSVLSAPARPSSELRQGAPKNRSRCTRRELCGITETEQLLASMMKSVCQPGQAEVSKPNTEVSACSS
jgi:two-component system CheB/CheR fusion protein